MIQRDAILARSWARVTAGIVSPSSKRIPNPVATSAHDILEPYARWCTQCVGHLFSQGLASPLDRHGLLPRMTLVIDDRTGTVKGTTVTPASFIVAVQALQLESMRHVEDHFRVSPMMFDTIEALTNAARFGTGPTFESRERNATQS